MVVPRPGIARARGRAATTVAGLAALGVLVAAPAGGSLVPASATPGPTNTDTTITDTTITPTPSAQPSPGPLPRDLATGDGSVPTLLAPRPPLPTAAGLARVLDPLLSSPTLGKRVTAAVTDMSTDTLIYGHSPSTPMTPASTTKLGTIVAALGRVGPETRFRTVVRRLQTAPGQQASIVLVGGGDPLLASSAGLALTRARGYDIYPTVEHTATIDALADRTAKALKAGHVTRVALRYDDSLFTEPVSTHWRSIYVATSVVSPVSALWVDQGRVRAPWATRVSDPSLDATRRFGALLARRGITVSGTPTRITTPGAAPEVASVESAPLREIVQHVLLNSDNDGAEVIARQVAVAAGQRADFAGAAAAVAAELRAFGIDLTDVRLYDGSGLSRDNRIPARTLVAILAVATARPQLAAVLAGLPIAGFNGTLAGRFRGPAGGGAGWVHAKTGTLTGVSTLAGTVTTRNGAVLSYAFMADQVTAWVDARPALDRLAAALASCGCR